MENSPRPLSWMLTRRAAIASMMPRSRYVQRFFYTALGVGLLLSSIPVSGQEASSGRGETSEEASAEKSVDAPSQAAIEERIKEFRDALREGKKRRVRKATEESGFLELVGEDGRTPVFAIVAALEAEVIDTVLAARPDLDFRDPEGKSVLIVAAEKGSALAVESLLAAGADAQAVDEGQRTALTYAALGGHAESARVLIENGAEVDVTDRNGATPLIYACAKGFYAVSRLLIENGANAQATTPDGMSALKLAQRKNAQRVVRLLRRHGAR